MMTNQDFRTLAYTKSPKTSKRTTFQDELQAAVSARASKPKTDRYSYSDDFNEDEDDFLNKLKSRTKKSGAFKKNKAKINNFELSDDEGKHERKKKVSFLKSQRISSPSEDTVAPESRENEPPDSSVGEHNDSFSSQHSTHVGEDDTEFTNSGCGVLLIPKSQERARVNLSHTKPQTILFGTCLCRYHLMAVWRKLQVLRRRATLLLKKGPRLHIHQNQTSDMSLQPIVWPRGSHPDPNRRQRTLGLSPLTAEKPPEETEAQDLSRPQTSSASIPLSTDTSSNTAVRSSSPHWTEGDHTGLSESFSNKSEHDSQLFTKSTIDSGSRDDFISDDSKEQGTKYSTSFEELHEDAGDHSDHSVAQLSHTQEKSFDTRTSSSHSKTTQRSQSACSRKVESKYLGTLRVLDRKVSLQESEPQAADSLRAAIYQEWLKKKKEKSRQKMLLKEKEEMLKEKKKKEEEVKKQDAVASYEAWKERKAEILKAKAKEKQDMIRKEQTANEEKEEKRQSAKQVFEKWKEEHDHLLKEKYRKQKEAENKLKLKKQEKEEERKRESRSAFSDWCEKKQDVLHEKATTKRKEIKSKEEEERYMKEERDKMALEVYENWLTRKDLEQRRRREERQIKEILSQDSPPPPWSPPNKTIPFRK
uniref:Microtubule-associated protein 9 n=1 Tax=Lates calcarifer TaxID=8187 RepID=A0A4W6BNL9_LATCA